MSDVNDCLMSDHDGPPDEEHLEEREWFFAGANGLEWTIDQNAHPPGRAALVGEVVTWEV